MSNRLSLLQVVSRVGQKLGTDWRDIPPDSKDRDYLAWKMSTHVWLHVLHGIKSGHLLTYIDTPLCQQVMVGRNAWPDIASLSNTTTKMFASIRTNDALTFSYETPDATFVDSRNNQHEGRLCVDRLTARSFQAFFKPEPYVLQPSGKWKDVGEKGENPALTMKDLLLEWSKTNEIELKPIRRSIIFTLERAHQKLPRHRQWLTPYGVFRSDGTLITPNYIQSMLDWTDVHDEDLEEHWSSSWVIGREWLRAWCEQDTANRPFPAFWENPTPSPPILTELSKHPSPLKGRKSSDIQERNKQWLSLALDIKKRNPNLSKSDICRQTAKDLGISRKWDSIRRTLNRFAPNWDKKVGQS